MLPSMQHENDVIKKSCVLVGSLISSSEGSLVTTSLFDDGKGNFPEWICQSIKFALVQIW